MLAEGYTGEERKNVLPFKGEIIPNCMEKR